MSAALVHVNALWLRLRILGSLRVKSATVGLFCRNFIRSEGIYGDKHREACSIAVRLASGRSICKHISRAGTERPVVAPMAWRNMAAEFSR